MRRPGAVRTIVVALVFAVVTVVAGGCGTEQGPAGTPAAEEETMSGGTSGTGDPQVDPRAQPAVADLADRLGIEPGEIEVRLVEGVTWRDGSLGCAKPGMMYTQALVEGVRIRLAVDGETYEYHAGGGQEPFLCEEPTQ